MSKHEDNRIKEIVAKTLTSEFDLLHSWENEDTKTIYVIVKSRIDLIFARLEYMERQKKYVFCQDRVKLGVMQ